MYTSTVQSGSSLLMLHFRPTLLFKLLIPHLPILYLLSLPSRTVPSSWLSSVSCFLSPPLTLSGLFNGMLEVFEPGALNYFTFFRPILSTLSTYRNSILTHLPLSGFLDSLICVLISPTPDLAFSFVMPRTLAAVLSFSSGRAYPSLNFLPSFFLRSIPTPIM